MNTRIENAEERPTIEVHEWTEGAPRPGTTEKARETCIDTLEIPPGGILPSVGDIIVMVEGPLDSMKQTRYRVIERELMWLRLDTPQDVPSWSKMWIHVRRLPDVTK